MAGGLFLLLLLTIFPFSLAMEGPVNLHARELESFNIRQDNSEAVEDECLYRVRIKTSCLSSNYTTDIISIAFGDAYGKCDAYGSQVQERRLHPPSRVFSKCSRNVFNIRGPCVHGICNMWLYRYGKNGWMPHSVKVTYGRRPVTFYFDFWLPNDEWSGFSRCSRIHPGLTNATDLPGQ